MKLMKQGCIICYFPHRTQMTNDEKRLCNIVLIQLSFDTKWAHFDTFSDDISQNNMQHD